MAQILIIDDEPQIVTMLSTFLKQEGHVVISARDGREGLKILTGGWFDIVITDIIMPESDGFEVLMSIRKMPNRPKIITMSGGTSYLRRDNLLEISEYMKADAVLQKPLNLKKLSTIIHELLSGG
jgi:DNA-binding response OmpR family regulator